MTQHRSRWILSLLCATSLAFSGMSLTAHAEDIVSLSTCTDEVMGSGSRGPCVKSLQNSLSAYGYVLDVDGVYGDETRLTVRAFQRLYHLADDGIAGPLTVSTLDRWANRPHADPNPRQVENPSRITEECRWWAWAARFS